MAFGAVVVDKEPKEQNSLKAILGRWGSCLISPVVLVESSSGHTPGLLISSRHMTQCLVPTSYIIALFRNSRLLNRRCCCIRHGSSSSSSSSSRSGGAESGSDDGDRQADFLTANLTAGKYVFRRRSQLDNGRKCFSRPRAALAVSEEAEGGFRRVWRGCWRLHPGGALGGSRSSVRSRRGGEYRLGNCRHIAPSQA